MNNEGANTIIRNMIADYLNVGTNDNPEWVLMGTGFNTLDENPQAQTTTKAYISDKAATSIIRAYQPQFPFDTDLIEDEKAVMELYNIGTRQAIGRDARRQYVRVELFLDTDKTDVHPARLFNVAVEVSNISGPGAEVVHVTGNLNGAGDYIEGEFNIISRTFIVLSDIGGYSHAYMSGNIESKASAIQSNKESKEKPA